MLLLLFASLTALADTHPLAFVICKLHGNVRIVRVEVDAQNICQTYYSKDGVEKLVGSGRNHDSCVQWLKNIKTNLEKSNWKCRDVESATVSESGK